MESATATVFYLDRKPYKNEKPYFCCLPPESLKGNPSTNHVHIPVDITATNIRPDIASFSLDKNGFEVAVQTLGPEFDYESVKPGSETEQRYIRQMEALLTERLNARKVVVFDVETRKRNMEFPDGLGEKSSLEQPVRGVHVDSSPASAVERAVYIARQLKDEELLAGRMQIINSWRPFFSDLEDWPLGLCDSRSVDIEDDIIPSDTVFPTNVAETLQVHHSPAHKWYFLDKQSQDELLLFKIFDSDDASSRVCPHAAIQPDLRGYGTGQPRESIETRAMVFYG
ncbi:hypothetical protein B0T21DRAFT_95618 [Apiosordaria backusii]|uniref:Uncharacterized protein n=1 Tax=Apiosordaria backusii TaxID=314023 RepID=A0AA40K3Y3_9PEZI|nr:hypothetical protein B0T21DRAFT_95618 [Apiosordaria backusii]